jgi:hypothetical protein
MITGDRQPGDRVTPRLAGSDGDQPGQCPGGRQRIKPGMPGIGDQRGRLDAPADELVTGHRQVADDADDRPGDARADVRGGAVREELADALIGRKRGAGPR